MDGLMGLGQPKTSSLGVPTIMDVLLSKKLITQNLFGVSLQRQSDGDNDGVVNFGDWDKSQFSGDLTWTPSVSNAGLWEIDLDGCSVGSKDLKLTGNTAIIDTGTSLLLLPVDDAVAIHAGLSSNYKRDNENFELPCSLTEPLNLVFSGVTYSIGPIDYLGGPTSGGFCASTIIARVR